MNSDLESAQSNNEYTFYGNVFFYCCDTGYQHLSVCLAEGLKELGIPFFSNINYWQISPEREEYLFCYEPSAAPDDCAVVVVEKAWLYQYSFFPDNLFHAERKYITVYLDDSDGPTIWNPEFRNFDYIFRTHCNSRSQSPSNCIPWSFGLSNRIIRETSNIPNFNERRRHLLVNFRVSQEQLELSNCWLRVDLGLLRIAQGFLVVDHPLRQIVCNHFFPLIQDILPVDDTVDNFEHHPSDSYHYLQWTQTSSRHYPKYYKRLKEFVACACFGGCIVPIPVTGQNLVEWWDSWRLWESLAAGCVTFHVDFEKYGIQLPVMPENWQHYVGIDLENMESAVDRIAGDLEILERISTAGRRWAIENYSPVPTALRFLKTIDYNGSTIQRRANIKGDLVTLKPIESLNNSVFLKLREVNLIVFLDWCQPEEVVYSNLDKILRLALSHPDKNRMSLLFDTDNFSEEDANLILSSAIMNILMEEDINITDGIEISTIGKLNSMQWEALLLRIHSRIILKNENEQAIAQARVESVPLFQLDSLANTRFFR